MRPAVHQLACCGARTAVRPHGRPCNRLSACLSGRATDRPSQSAQTVRPCPPGRPSACRFRPLPATSPLQAQPSLSLPLNPLIPSSPTPLPSPKPLTLPSPPLSQTLNPKPSLHLRACVTSSARASPAPRVPSPRAPPPARPPAHPFPLPPTPGLRQSPMPDRALAAGTASAQIGPPSEAVPTMPAG